MDKHLFAERIEEAHTLYELAKGTQYEDTCWAYYESVMRLAKIAGGLKRRSFLSGLPCTPATDGAHAG